MTNLLAVEDSPPVSGLPGADGELQIITELVKKAQSDELRRFNLSSFMSDRSLEEVFQEIDKDMKFFSIYVFGEWFGI
jgi:hypothetical protein